MIIISVTCTYKTVHSSCRRLVMAQKRMVSNSNKPSQRLKGVWHIKESFFFFFLGGGGAADRECAGYVFFYKSQKRGFSFRSVQKFVCDRHLKLPASSMYKW